jgi:hypothetical protein
VRTFLYPALFLISAALGVLSLAEWASLSLDSARQDQAVVITKQSALAQTEKGFLPDADRYVQSYSELRLLAQKEKDPAQRIELLCHALEQVGNAIRLRPQHSVYLVNWANVRQVLGASHECGRPYTSGDFREAVAFALSSDPTNPSVLFSAGLIRQWAGDEAGAWHLFHQVLLLGVDVPQGQLDYIQSQITSPAALKAIVPARFPQINHWSRQLQKQSFVPLREISPALASLQLSALAQSKSEYEQGRIPIELQIKRLQGLLALGVTNVVRQTIDAELAELLEHKGEQGLAQYLRARSKLVEIQVNRAYVDSDTRPLKGALGAWNDQRPVLLDQFYSSIGFFVPMGAWPRLIELHAQTEVSSFSTTNLKFLVSDDNQRWMDVQGEVRTEKFVLANHTVVAAHSDVEPSKYWKIHFASSSRDKLFYNGLEQLVKVYVAPGGL